MNRIAWIFVLALVVGLMPAMADTWSFSFNGDGTSGAGTFDVNAGVIVGLTGTFEPPTPAVPMTLLAPGAFASNDNVFTGTAPWVTENGFSFEAASIDYNIYYAASTTNYAFTVCLVGQDCITSDPFGNPSTTVNFSATQVPDGGTTLSLLGLAIVGLAGLRRKLSL
jgi:hypothetical protein